ncbi:MAG: amino acid racemase [Candidatus Micrarchaeia archaeon]
MSVIGIIGGMGPESTAYTYIKMIEYCQKRYNAKFDRDFPPIIIYSLPIEDIVENTENEDKILNTLCFGVNKIKTAGATFGFVACNSMQKFIPKLRQSMQMLSIIEEVNVKMQETKIKKVGILGTKTTMDSQLYQKAFEKNGIETVEPREQEKITYAIMEILAGKKSWPEEILLGVVDELKKENIEGIILACTDLPIVLNQENCGIKIFDSAKIIAEASIDKYYTEKTVK